MRQSTEEVPTFAFRDLFAMGKDEYQKSVREIRSVRTQPRIAVVGVINKGFSFSGLPIGFLQCLGCTLLPARPEVLVDPSALHDYKAALTLGPVRDDVEVHFHWLGIAATASSLTRLLAWHCGMRHSPHEALWVLILSRFIK